MGGAEQEHDPDHEESPQELDPAARLLGERVVRSLRLEPDRWARWAGSPEAEPLLRAFLGGVPERRLLLVTLGAGGQLALGEELPLPAAAGRSGKGVFLLRTTPGHLLCGDLLATPLDHLATLVEEVVVPLLANQKNHQNWPHVVSQDVAYHVCSLKSSVFVVVGQVKGKTLLPLPAGSEGTAYIDFDHEKTIELVDKSIVHAIESAVIEWTYQIQQVLKRESSELLLQGQDPRPKVELDFWKNRCEDLQCIYNQLNSKRILTMVELLERVQSSYFPAFRSMFRDVEAALVEAQDINMHLMPLQRPLEEIENAEFNEVKPLLNNVLHVVCLIWATSKYYSTPVRIIVLLQEICSLLIQQARNYLNGEDLLKGETEESLGKVQKAFDILNYFKQTFEERKENINTYFQPGQESKKWDFPSIMVFAQLDNFLERLHVVDDLLMTALDIEKLEKLEFSGIRGKILSQQVLNMYEEFQEMYKVFSEHTHDCLDVASMEFEDDVCDFKEKVEDMDQRLGTIFGQAFDDAPSVEHAFKLIDIFGNLLERPLVAAVAYAKYHLLVTMFDRDLDDAKLIYLNHIQQEMELGYPPVHRNMPLVAGGLRWAQELKARIQIPFSNFRHLTNLCMDSTEGKRMMQKYEDLMQLLEEYQEKLYKEWFQTVSEKSQYNLTRPLIRRDPESNLIAVNFDPQLVSVLREVSYLGAGQIGKIPETAAEIYSFKESFRQLVANLELMVAWYNKILRTVLEVEYPLVQGQLQDIDIQLKEAEETLNWKTEGLWDRVSRVVDSVRDLEQRIQKTKDNIDNIQNIMKSWVSPIFERKDGKRENLLNLDDQHERLDKHYRHITDSGHKIHFLIEVVCMCVRMCVDM